MMAQQRPAPLADLDAVADQFDRHWRTGLTPDLKAFLGSNASGSWPRHALLVELIAIDLEYRWKSARGGDGPAPPADGAGAAPWRLETYAERWPELGPLEEIPVALIAEEYRVRQRWGDRPAHAEYRQRFPGRGDEVVRRLAEVDADLRRDAAALTDTRTSGPTARWGVGKLFGEDSRTAARGTFQPRELGRYRLLRVLGQGAMGVVYLAEDRDLGRKVALKTPRLENASDERVARFLNEARTAAALNHPNLCPVYDVGWVDGQHFITMAYLEGQTLAERIRGQGPLPVPEAVTLAAKTARAMQAAHDAGVVHRDLKSSNVLIDTRKEPVVMDFGLARRVQADADARLTQSGEVIGSPAYMAPEQVEGRSGDIGPATDVYALGVILYEMLTGHLPFRGGTGGVLAQILRDPPPPLAAPKDAIPPELEALCLRLLAKHPQDRPASMQDVARELAAIGERLETQADTQPLTPLPVQAQARRRRRPVAAAVAGLALLALTALASAPLVLRVQTEQGEIVVKSYDPDIAVTLKRNGRPVDHFTLEKGPVATRVRTGDIEVEIKGANADGVCVKNRRFELTRGKTVVVEILGPEVAAPGKGHVPARSPFDSLRREDIPTHELAAAGGGDPARAPAELVAVLGDSRMMHRTLGANDVAFHPGGRVLASAGDDGAARLWDVGNGTQLDSLSVDRIRMLSVSYSPGGDRIAVGGGRGLLKVWDAWTPKELLAIPGLSGDVSSLDWSPDGQRLVGIIVGDHRAGEPSRVRAWDAATGREVFALEEKFPGPNIHLALSPDGKRLSTSYSPGKAPPQVKLWDAQSGRHLSDLKHGQTRGDVYGLAWSPDGKQLAAGVGGDGRAILLWDVEGRRPARALETNKAVASLAWSPDRKWLAVGQDDQVALWDTRTWELVRRLTCEREAGYFNELAFNHDGKLLAGAGHRGAVALWDVASGKAVVSPQGHVNAVTGVSVSPDGQWVATSSFDRTARLWPVAAGRPAGVLWGGPGWLNDVAFSPDGTRLAATGLAPNGLTVWDAASQQRRYVLPAEAGSAVVSAAWSPDGERLALGCTSPALVKVVSAASGQELYRTEAAKNIAPQVSFSPDGRWLAVGGEGVVVCDAATGKEIRSIATPPHVRSVQFSPDGKHLLVAGDFPNPILYDAESGKEVRRLLSAGEHNLLGAAYNRDGTRIATLNAGRRLTVWDAATGESRRRVQLPEERRLSYNRLAFAPDGRHVLVANNDGTVYVLRLESGPVTPVRPATP